MVSVPVWQPVTAAKSSRHAAPKAAPGWRRKTGEVLPDYSFGRELRLLTADDYRRVFKKPQRFSDRFFTLLVSPNGAEIARLGLAVAKKHIKQATGRNRLKRLARESFRLRQQQLAGLDIVVLPRSASATASKQDLLHSLDTHWSRIAAIHR